MELNAAQQEVLDQLGASRGDRPRFEVTLRHQLRRDLDDGLESLLPSIADDDTLFIAKHLLGQVHGCERKFLAEEDEPFAWSVPIARGTVAHKAIELSIHWKREPDPLVLVDESLARLADGSDGMGEFLRQSSEVERAELRAEANDRVVKFLECFPPLKPAWRPVTESRLRLELHDARIVLSGKVDLSLGQPDGDRAGKVLVDLKTGGFSPGHLHDLRFYALIETIRLGTPPRRLATYYLDQGRFVPEDVTEDLLHSAVARVVDGAHRVVELRAGADDVKVIPSPVCRWCPALDGCDEGRRHLDDAADSVGVDW
jgi:hypothetical protein